MTSVAKWAALSGLLVLFAAPGALASTWTFDGRVVLQFSNLGRVRVLATGTGVAIVNGSGTGTHLNTLSIAEATGTLNTVVPVTDPIVTAGGIVEVRLTSVMGFDGALQGGQGGIFGPVSGAIQNTAAQLTMNTAAVVGSVRICLFYAGCNSGSLDQDLDQTNGTGMHIGGGVGGLITLGGSGAIRISILGAPWTVKTVTVSNRTDNANITYFVRNGFAHGPASLTSSTVAASGVLQLVVASQTTTVGVPGNADLSGNISSNRIHFVPEPGMLLLLGAGAAGMVLLGGRNRIKK